MSVCANCGGFIGEPGKAYGYAGKWCHCPINPATQYQRPTVGGQMTKHCDRHQNYWWLTPVLAIRCKRCVAEDKLSSAKEAACQCMQNVECWDCEDRRMKLAKAKEAERLAARKADLMLHDESLRMRNSFTEVVAELRAARALVDELESK